MTDILGNSSTSASVSVGTVTSSAIDTLGDHDWFKVTLNAGQTITITATGGGGLDTYLNIYDPTGTTILASNDDIVDGVNQDSRITFTASSAGTYFIDVGSYNEQTTGTYDLFVEPSPQPVFTYDQVAFQLTNGYWGGDVHHWAVTQGGTLTVNISTLTAAEQTLARAALQEWSDVIGVHFQEVTSGAQITFSDAEDTTAKGPVAQTDANWGSNGIITSAHIQISQSWVTNYGTSIDSYSFQSYLHEIGHALGLGHGGEYNNTATYSTDALYANDGWPTTIMSYFDQQENSYFANQGFSKLYAVTPMDADVLAMQSLYGLSTTTRTGNTVYGDNSNAGSIYDAIAYPRAEFAIFDSGGNDTIDYSRVGVSQLINLNPETFSNVNGYTGNLTIAPGTVIENAIGGSGADTIIGNSANNVITGNLGADTLTGGAGNDTFLDTAAGHAGDTITDFAAGDTIVFSDASLTTFTFSVSGHTLNYTGGSLTLTNVPAGTLVASAAASGGVQLAIAAATVPHQIVAHDFNGDSRSDILLRNDNGTLAEWTAQAGGSFAGNANVNYALGTDWQVAGIGDFNGDGKSDLLLRNTNGSLAEWTGQSNGSFVGNSHVNYALSTNWQIAGVGDFNGDGRSDMLLRNINGSLAEWTGQADGSFVGNASVNYALGTAWHVAGTGDFNGDGRSDILLRNDNGALAEWIGQADGSFVGNASVNYPLGTDWQVDGVGDFNGDGRSDLLLRNTNSGALAEWTGQSNGGFVGNASVNQALGTDWHIAQIGDFNGDGMADLLWHNNNGAIAEWTGQVDGSFVANAGVNYALDTSWHVQDPFLPLI